MIMRSEHELELARQWRWVRYLIEIGRRGTPMKNKDGTPTDEYAVFCAIERMRHD